MTDLPDLPDGWAWAIVEQIGKVQLGRQRSPKNHEGPHMRPYLRVANVFEDRIDTSDVMSMNFGPEEFERYRLVDGDVLLNEGQSPELLGRPALYRGVPADTAFTNSLIRFQAEGGILPEWALTVFRRHMHFGRFTRESRITTNIAHLSANRFKTVEFPVPPTEEQRRIVAKLEALLSDIFRAQQGIEQVRRRLGLARQAVLNGIVRDSGQPAREPFAAPVHSARKNTPQAPKVIPGAVLPSGWVWHSLDELITSDRRAAYGVLQPGDHVERGVRLVRVADIAGGVVATDVHKRIAPDIHEKYPRTQLEGGELLITLVGTIGRVAVVPPSLAGANVARAVGVIPLHPCVNPHFVALALQAEPFRTALTGRAHEVARKTLNLEDVRTFPIPLPPRAEQDRLVREAEATLAGLSRVEKSLSGLQARLVALVRGSLGSAVSGRLVSQVSTDEPAANLLKRITEDRAVRSTAERKTKRAVRTTRTPRATKNEETSA